MKKKALLTLALASLLVAGCGPATTDNSSVLPDSTPTVDPSTPVVDDPSTPIVDSSIPVDPQTIEITTEATSLWFDETLQMEYEYSKATTDGVIWSSSDTSVATISETGLLTAQKAGTSTITVKSESDDLVTDSVTITVKDEVIDRTTGSGNWNFDHLRDDNPSVSTTKTNAEWPYAEVRFKNVLSQKYYVEAVFNVSEVNYGNEWNRIAIGHRNVGNGDAYVLRGLHVSYGSNNAGNSKKTIVMETPLEWGVTTDRTQVWHSTEVKALDFTNLKIATLRDGNSYYYYLNDKLAWMETVDTRFYEVDTTPALVACDMHATVSSMKVTTDETEIDTILASAESNRKFYTLYPSNTIIDEANNTIQFTNNNDTWPFDNIKDNSAASIGDAFILPANTPVKISFNLKFDEFGSDNTAALAGVNFSQYSGRPTETLGFMVGKYEMGMTGWNRIDNMPAIGYPKTLETPIVAGETHLIEITRTFVDNKHNWEMAIDGVDYGYHWCWQEYTGVMTLTSVGTQRANATISNLAVTELAVK